LPYRARVAARKRFGFSMTEIFDDIKKIYQFSPPCGELAYYIEFFSESSFEETARYAGDERFTVKMFPSWTPTFWINLGTPYQLVSGQDTHVIKPQDDILVLRDTIVTRHNLPSDYIFSVKFFPGGLEAIFGINQTKFINTVVDLTTIIPAQLLQSIKRPMTFQQRMELLQNFFLHQHSRQKKKDHYLQLVQDSIALYGENGMQYNTGEIAGKLFLTSKTINRYFLTVVGISPKKYFSILRARTALTAYVAAKHPFAASNAFSPCDFGFHDMSHFYKEIARFTGNTIAAGY
jgi:AraC-like DNA-binding protein